LSKAKTDAECVEWFTDVELTQVWNLLSGVAKLLESERKEGLHVKGRAMAAKTVKAPLPKPKVRARSITGAETWNQRDIVCRGLSAWAYEMAKVFLEREDTKNAQKWITLSQRFLKLSMTPKKTVPGRTTRGTETAGRRNQETTGQRSLTHAFSMVQGHPNYSTGFHSLVPCLFNPAFLSPLQTPGCTSP
jgi:hypothetical protein